MIDKYIGRALAAAAAAAVALAARTIPSREVDFFTHKAPQRRPWRVDAWMMQPGWLWVEVGQWTLEVAWKPREELQGPRRAIL